MAIRGWPFNEVETEDRAVRTDCSRGFRRGRGDHPASRGRPRSHSSFRIEVEQSPGRSQIAQTGINDQVKADRDEILIERDIRSVAGDGIEIGEIERAQAPAFCAWRGPGPGDRKLRARCFEPADNDRGCPPRRATARPFLRSSTGMTWKECSSWRFGLHVVVLVHEWVTGGGLAGMPLPASWEREGSAMRRAIARDFAALPSERYQSRHDA